MNGLWDCIRKRVEVDVDVRVIATLFVPHPIRGIELPRTQDNTQEVKPL